MRVLTLLASFYGLRSVVDLNRRGCDVSDAPGYSIDGNWLIQGGYESRDYVVVSALSILSFDGPHCTCYA